MIMKKIVACILFLIISISSVFVIHAYDEGKNVYQYEEINVEIIFDEADTLNNQQKERVAEILAYDLTPSETRAWCWLTGHEKTIHTVTKLTHKVREANPRCLEETYNVTVCANCNYYEEELIAQYYTICCPEE